MKYAVKLRKRAYMTTTVMIEADSPAEARKLVKKELESHSATGVTGEDGQAAESVYDLHWKYDELDETDALEVISANPV